jgi:soluble cytochrome b562
VVDIMSALATASQAIKLAQDLRGIDRAIDAAEYKLKIADLTSALSDIKLALTDAKEDLATKDAEINKLKRQFQRLTETVEYQGFKYDKGKDGKPSGAAYCPVCEQKTGLLFHLSWMEGDNFCPNCKANFSRVHVFGHDN